MRRAGKRNAKCVSTVSAALVKKRSSMFSCRAPIRSCADVGVMTGVAHGCAPSLSRAGVNWSRCRGGLSGSPGGSGRRGYRVDANLFRGRVDRRSGGSYICMMAQVSKKQPATPRQAGNRRWPIDDLLSPALFKALADPTRARLLACVAKCGRPCTVGEVAECCAVDLSVVSRHLSALELGGLMTSRKEGRTVRYSVRYEEVCGRLRALADAIEACCPPGGCKGGRCGCA